MSMKNLKENSFETVITPFFDEKKCVPSMGSRSKLVSNQGGKRIKSNSFWNQSTACFSNQIHLLTLKFIKPLP